MVFRQGNRKHGNEELIRQDGYYLGRSDLFTRMSSRWGKLTQNSPRKWRWLDCEEHCITVEEGERWGERGILQDILLEFEWTSRYVYMERNENFFHFTGKITIGNQQTKRLPYVIECRNSLCDSHLKWKDNVWMGSPARFSEEHPLSSGAD